MWGRTPLILAAAMSHTPHQRIKSRKGDVCSCGTPTPVSACSGGWIAVAAVAVCIAMFTLNVLLFKLVSLQLEYHTMADYLIDTKRAIDDAGTVMDRMAVGVMELMYYATTAVFNATRC